MLLIAFCSKANAQSVREINDSVDYYLGKIEKTDTSYPLSFRLLKFLKRSLIRNPSAMDEISEMLGGKIVISDDGNVSIYCWSAFPAAGPNEEIAGMIRYKTVHGIKAKELSDFGNDDFLYGYCEKVYSIERKKNGRFYLALYKGKYVEGIKAYDINNDKIEDTIKKFRTQYRSYNELSYSYEWRYDSLGFGIDLSSDNQKLYIPVVNKDGFKTSHYLVYIFDGNNYVFDKNAK